MAGSSSTTRTVTGLPVMIDPFGLRRDRGARRGHRQGNGEDRARAVPAIARYDRSAHRLDEAAADGEAEPGAGALPVGAPDAVELLEDMREMLGWDAAAFVENLDHQAVALPARPQRDRRAGRRVFPGIVEQIEKDLLEQNEI